LKKAFDAVIAECPDETAAFRNGKEKVFGFLIGQVMRPNPWASQSAAARTAVAAKIG
jgi:Asp-tRNA(Asn)/Glu-tRNA(Gln) amidotransferase B subunit